MHNHQKILALSGILVVTLGFRPPPLSFQVKNRDKQPLSNIRGNKSCDILKVPYDKCFKALWRMFASKQYKIILVGDYALGVLTPSTFFHYWTRN